MTAQEPFVVAQARALGGHAADAYWDEFEAKPEDEPDAVGDWDTSAWELHWKHLVDSGATDADYDACLSAWRDGFWGRTTATA